MKKVKSFLMTCVLILSAFSFLQYYMNSESVTVSVQTMNGTDVVTDIGTFANDVNLVRGKTSGDVSDLKRTLSFRGTYKMQVYGFNLPLLNMKKNIISVEKVRMIYEHKEDKSFTSRVVKSVANFAVKQSGVDLLGDLISGIN